MGTGVQFEEEKIGGMTASEFQSALYSKKQAYSPAVAFVIRIKLFKTERQARVFILAAALVVVCVGMYFLNGAMQPPEIIELRVHKL